MNGIACYGWQILQDVVTVYTVLLFVYAVISWIPSLRGRWVYYLSILIEPVLRPIRRVVPPLGGLDLAFLVLFALLQFVVSPIVRHFTFSSCFLTY